MVLPTSHPWAEGDALDSYLTTRGVSRRDFLGFCAQMTAALGLAGAMTPRIAAALAAQRRPTVVWLSLQECTGCVESVLRTAEPTIGDLVLDVISLDYQHNAHGRRRRRRRKPRCRLDRQEQGRVPARGHRLGSAQRRRRSTPPSAAARPRRSWRRPREGANAVIAVGACAHWGNVQAARPNPTGAVGVGGDRPGQAGREHRGLPADRRRGHGDVVHYLTFGRVPALDAEGRPLFAYGARIHDQCPAARPLRRRPVRRGVRRRGARARAGASTRSAARGRRRSRRAPSSCGTPGRAGRSAPGIRASAAPSASSGTP